MEWTYAKQQSSQTLKAFFAGELDYEDDEKKYELLAVSRIKRGVCYAASRFINKTTGEDRVSALVIQVVLDRGRRSIGYKVQTEYENPAHYHCPLSIYELLTRFRHCAEDAVLANKWRRRVEGWNRHMQEAPPLNAGMRVVFNVPLQFDNGDALAQFTVESTAPYRLRGENGTVYRVRDLLERIGRGDARLLA